MFESFMVRSLCALTLLTAACNGGGDVLSPVYPQFAPFRHGEAGSLGYAALHFTEIYGVRDNGPLHPVRPVLGYPAFVQPGVTRVSVEYLGFCDSGGDALERIQISLATTPPTPLTIDPSGTVIHRVGYDRKTARAVCWVRLLTVIPAAVAPGFYGLVHQVTGTAKKATTVPSAVAVWNGDPAAGRDFSFVHLSDLHQRESRFGAYRYKDILPPDMMPDVVLPGVELKFQPNLRVLRSIHMINTLRPRPDLVVVTGDIVDHGDEAPLWRAVYAALTRLQIPIILVPGNHDYAHKDSITPTDPQLSKGDLGLINFMTAFHPFLAPRIELLGYRWMGIDTGLSATYKDISRLAFITTTGLTSAQIADIKRFLATPSPRGHILFGHTPTRTSIVGWADAGKVGESGAFGQGSKEMEQLLLAAAQSGKHVVYLNGHVHWNDVFSVPDPVSDRPYRLRRRRPVKKASMPCFADLKISESPLLISTQSTTKPQKIDLDWSDPGIGPGEDPGDGIGFRLIRADASGWMSAIYRFSDERDTIGQIAAGADQVSALPGCH